MFVQLHVFSQFLRSSCIAVSHVSKVQFSAIFLRFLHIEKKGSVQVRFSA
jgi:hypothetical protein